MLCIVNRIAVQWGLISVARWVRRCQILLQSDAGRLLQQCATLTSRVPHGCFIDRPVEEMMPDQLVLQCPECVCSIRLVATMKPVPVNQVDTACSTAPALARSHPLKLLE